MSYFSEKIKKAKETILTFNEEAFEGEASFEKLFEDFNIGEITFGKYEISKEQKTFESFDTYNVGPNYKLPLEITVYTIRIPYTSTYSNKKELLQSLLIRNPWHRHDFDIVADDHSISFTLENWKKRTHNNCAKTIDLIVKDFDVELKRLLELFNDYESFMNGVRHAVIKRKTSFVVSKRQEEIDEKARIRAEMKAEKNK